MLPQRWITLLIVTFLAGLFLRVDMLSTISLALMIIIWVANWWKNKSLQNVVYERKFHYTRGFPGEEGDVEIKVENNKLLPVSWLRVRDLWPKAIGPDNEDILAPTHTIKMGQLVNIFSLRWFETARRKYRILFRERGVYKVGPAKLESGDLFGLYSTTKEVPNDIKLTVFPTLVPLSEIEFPAEDPFGDKKSRKKIFRDPSRPMGVREYRPEDSFRRVHWPATARTGELKVKVLEPTSAQVLVACLNAATFPRHWEGVYPELLEHLVSVTASIVKMGIDDGYQVGMISNGTLAYADQPFRIPPGRSGRQLSHMLTALASVTPVVSAPFNRFLLREVPRVPYGSTLMIITAVMTPALAETILRVKHHGRRIVLVSVAKEAPPAIEGIRMVHIPYQEELELVPLE